MKLKQCVDDFEEMKKKRSGSWESPEVEVMCRVGLGLGPKWLLIREGISGFFDSYFVKRKKKELRGYFGILLGVSFF